MLKQSPVVMKQGKQTECGAVALYETVRLDELEGLSTLCVSPNNGSTMALVRRCYATLSQAII